MADDIGASFPLRLRLNQPVQICLKERLEDPQWQQTQNGNRSNTSPTMINLQLVALIFNKKRRRRSKMALTGLSK